MINKRIVEREHLVLVVGYNGKWIQDYDYWEVYRIETEQGDLLVSHGHKIYVKEENYSKESRNLDNLSVVNMGTSDCSLKCGSLDQIGMLSSSANAKKGTSVLCEINLSALSLKESEEFFNSIISDNKEISFKNFSLVTPDLEQITLEYLDSSSISSLGANNSIEYSFNSLFVNELDLNNENITLVSTTNFIYDSLCFSDIACLSSLPSLIQSLSVSLDFSKSFSNLSNISSCFILFMNASLASADQFSHANLSIFCFNSPGIDNVIDTILTSTYDTFDNVYYVYKPFDFKKLDDLVSLWHKIYVKEDSEELSVSFNSFVFNILTLDCCLNDGSLDQIAQSSFNASAKYGISLLDLCGDNCLAFDSNVLYSEGGIIEIFSFNSLIIDSTLLEDNLVCLIKSGMFLFNSSKTCAGENSCKLKKGEFRIMNLTGLSLKNENSMLASTTNFIYHPSFLCLCHARSFTSFPSLIQSSSVNSDFSNNLSNFLSNNALLTFSDKNLRTDSDTLSSGNESIFFFNSSGIDNVKFGIFLPPHSSVYPVENVQVFKLFDREDLSDFDLIEISDIYEKDLANEHKIYAGVKNIYPNDLSFSTNSLVLNTLTNDCSLKCGSLDQTGILLSAKDNARYSVSSLSEIIELDCLINFSYLDNEKDLIFSFNLFNNRFSSTEERFDRILIRDLCSSTSLNRDSGQYSFTASEKIISFVVPVPINPVNNTVASITNSIYNSSGCNFFNFLYIPLFTSFANFSASSSVNLDLDTILLNSLNSSSNSIRLIASSLASSDQFTHGNFSIIALNSSEIFNVMLTIYNSPLCLISSNFSNAFALFFNLDLNTSDQFTSECLSIFFFNSSGIDNVSVGILAPPNVLKQDVVNTQKGVDIYKSFGQSDLSDFKPTRISGVYDIDKRREFINMFGE